MFKLFRTAGIHVVNYCASMFGAKLPSELLGIRCAKFLSKFDFMNCSADLTNLFNYVCYAINFFH